MRHLWNIIQNALFPKSCIFCRKENLYVCTQCELLLPRHTRKTPDDKTFIKYNYKDKKVKKILFKIKYFHNKHLANELGMYYSPFVAQKLMQLCGVNNFVIVPVPISRERLRQRGYNQSLELARGLVEVNQDIKISEAVKKIKNTEKMSTRHHREERSAELHDAFVIDPIELAKIKGKNIILLDDITTSGATFYAMKSLLIANGVETRNIYCFAVAG